MSDSVWNCCPVCGNELERRSILRHYDEYTGDTYDFPVECDWCSECNDYVLGKEYIACDTMMNAIYGNILVNRYGTSSEYWMSVEEASNVLGRTAEDMNNHLVYWIFNAVIDGTIYFFRKSVEQFLELKNQGKTATGLFYIGQ